MVQLLFQSYNTVLIYNLKTMNTTCLLAVQEDIHNCKQIKQVWYCFKTTKGKIEYRYDVIYDLFYKLEKP